LEEENNDELSYFINEIDSNDYTNLYGIENMEFENKEWEYDMMLVVNEFKDTYELKFSYNIKIMNENEINEIIRNFMENSLLSLFWIINKIIENKEFLFQNIEKISQKFLN